VHDVDLVVLLFGWRVHRPLAQIPGIVHAAVAGRVDFHDIETGRAVPDPDAALAFAAGIAGRLAAGAVARHGQDAGGGSLAHAARPGQQVAVSHPVVLDGPAQHGGNVVLDQEVGKPPGPVPAREGYCHGERVESDRLVSRVGAV